MNGEGQLPKLTSARGKIVDIYSSCNCQPDLAGKKNSNNTKTIKLEATVTTKKKKKKTTTTTTTTR